MRRFAVLALVVAGLLGGVCGARANTVDLQCDWTNGAGMFQFSIDYGKNLVTVGRFSAIPAMIDQKTISFNYYLGQLWGKEIGQHYFVIFDRGSGNYSLHSAGGEYPNGKRWLEYDAVAMCTQG